MLWTDTHFHSGEYLPDFERYTQEAGQAGVGILLLCASGAAEVPLAKAAAERFPGIYYAAGIHPHNAESDQDFLPCLESFAEDPKLAAAGEIGLDYFYDFCPRSVQLKVLEDQLDWALKKGLPAVIHCRDKADSEQAYEDAYLRLKSFAERGGNFVLHCYAGTPEFAEKFAALGGYFGVGGMITFGKADNIRELAKLLPMDRLLLETDAPYLAPKPYRGKPNHSRYIPLIGAKLAEIKGIPLEECAGITTTNARRLFSKIQPSGEEEL
ncbi:MAG: TatD family hydrolase [Lentisphaeria bacterium]|nr:TatD family hydrolase [Lentisphaeria bacterium]